MSAAIRTTPRGRTVVHNARGEAIEIGICHERPTRAHHDADALRVQRALNNEPPPTDKEGVVIVAGTLAILLFVGLLAQVVQ